ncbi:MAG: hypothetical protein WCS93_06395 [Candidatus Delongbacteria bacterium]
MKLIEELKKYIKDTLGIEVSAEKAKAGNLPFYLTDKYDFYKIKLLNEYFIVINSIEDNSRPTPSEIQKHILALRKYFIEEIIYSDANITSFNRKRLIEKHIPFVIPKTQLYLPMLKIDLREHFSKKTESIKYLSPSAQLVFIYLILNDFDLKIPAQKLALLLNTSVMTINRAFKEMKTAGICGIEKKGKENNYSFIAGRKEIIQKALPFLRSPVSGEFWIDRIPNDIEFYRSGLDALSEISQIAKGKNIEAAISKEEFKKLKSILGSTEYEPGQGCKLEIWSYPPGNLAENGIVDQLSLYLCLKDTGDERIKSEIDKIYKGLLK